MRRMRHTILHVLWDLCMSSSVLRRNGGVGWQENARQNVLAVVKNARKSIRRQESRGILES